MRFNNSPILLTISGIVGLSFCFSVFAADGKEANLSDSSTFKPATFIKVSFFPESQVVPPVNQEPDPPSFTGKLWPKMETKKSLRPGVAALGEKPSYPLRTLVAGVTAQDAYVHEGAETAIAVNWADSNNLMALSNSPGGGNTSIPFPTLLDLVDDSNQASNSIDGNQSWTLHPYPEVTTPDMMSIMADPWANAGNSAGEFFASFLQVDTSFSYFRILIARSIDGGDSFSLFFDKSTGNYLDREMVDVDRDSARGGGTGSTHDSKVYLGYDKFLSVPTPTYIGSYLQVISSTGTPLTEVQVSGPIPQFFGSFIQPVAGITDGEIYLGSSGVLGATSVHWFHEITNAGAGPNILHKSTFSWARAGHQLGTSNRWGFNGFKVTLAGSLDMDRSNGPGRGRLYFVSSRNPNPSDTTLDQGDIYISFSSDGASTWSSAILPTAAGKSQYFTMLDVDDYGIIHVAYYQNETGLSNNGVLNASSANIYYTLSYDGGNSWLTPVQINDNANTLDFEDPPLDRSSVIPDYYAIGDYAQLQATSKGPTNKAYVLWSGYDKDRSDTMWGDFKNRVICTSVGYVACIAKPGDADSSNTYTLADVISIVNYIFNKAGCSPQPLCWLSNLLCRGDWNGSGTVSLADVIRAVNFIFNKPNGPWNAVPVGVCCLP